MELLLLAEPGDRRGLRAAGCNPSRLRSRRVAAAAGLPAFGAAYERERESRVSERSGESAADARGEKRTALAAIAVVGVLA